MKQNRKNKIVIEEENERYLKMIKERIESFHRIIGENNVDKPQFPKPVRTSFIM